MNVCGYSTMPQAGIDPPAQSHDSYEASALPQATMAGLMFPLIYQINLSQCFSL